MAVSVSSFLFVLLFGGFVGVDEPSWGFAVADTTTSSVKDDAAVALVVEF